MWHMQATCKQESTHTHAQYGSVNMHTHKHVELTDNQYTTITVFL